MSRHSIPAWLRFGFGLVLGATVSMSAWAGNTAITVNDGSTEVTGPSGTTLIFPISRSGDLSYDAYLSYKTQDGSAIAGQDYTGAKGIFKIPAGSANADLRIPVSGSSVNGPDKTFTLDVLGASSQPPKLGFAAPKSSSVGADPNWVTTADINGDGLPDVIAVNYDDNTVSVLINTTAPGAAPSFAPQQTFAVGTGPTTVHAADINGDGKTDLIVANLRDNTVSVLINTTPTGATVSSFATQQTFATGHLPSWAAVADLNGDGKPDLVVGNNGDQTVSVFVNTTAAGAGTATFAAQQVFGFQPNLVGIAADVNGDGVPDILASGASSSFSVLVNTTTAGSPTVSFSPEQRIDTGNDDITYVAVGDLNGDGLPDVAFSTGIDDSVVVMMNTTTVGSTTMAFAVAQTFAADSATKAIAIADVDGDGVPDVIVGNDDGKVSVLLNTTSPWTTSATFQPQVAYSTGTTVVSGMTMADIDGDGKPDIVAVTDFDTAVVLSNDTIPLPVSFATEQRIDSGNDNITYTAVGDLNGDGLPDVAFSTGIDDSVVVMLNTTPPGATTMTYGPAQTFPADSSTKAIAIADVNGDGLPDMIAGNDDGSVSVFINTTAPGATSASFMPQVAVPTWATVVNGMIVADVNGDGKPDIVTVTDFDTIVVLLNTTAPGSTVPTFASPQAFAVGADPQWVTAADVNGDGNPDLIAVDYDDNTVSVLINTTTPGASALSFMPQQTFAVGNGPYTVHAADINGDGLPDLVVANLRDNTLSVLLDATPVGATAASFAAQQTFAVGNQPVWAAAADLNGDGKPDLVVGASADQTVSVLVNTTPTGASTASFAAQQQVYGFQATLAGVVADVNGDGVPDIIAGGAGINFSVLVNQLEPVSSTRPAATGTIHYEINTPVVMLTPTSASLGNVSLGQSSSAYPVDLFNDGTGDLTNLVVSVSGANAADFSQSNSCPASLAPNQRCTIYVTFTPGAIGARSATLGVVSNAGSSPDSVSLSGTGIGAAATANNGSVTTTANQPVGGTLSATLGYTGQTLTFQVVNTPVHGTVTITNAATGAFTYTPAGAYVGADSFRFYAVDGNGTPSNIATESVTVSDVAPTANNGSVSTSPDTAVNGDLAATAAYSGQTLSYAVVANPVHGTVSVTASTGAFTYTPANGYAGPDGFTFKVTDGAGTASNVASESVTVSDAAATANNGTLSIIAGQAGNGTLSATAAYAGQTLTYSVVGSPADGTVSITNPSTGAYTYTPGTGFAGPDSFSFKVTDAVGTPSNTATVSVTVSDQAATANNGNVSTTPDAAVNGTILASNGYPGQTFTYSIVSQPAHGSVTLNNNVTGSFTYTPARGFAGADSFTFKAIDAYGTSSNTATESVTVNDQAPNVGDGGVSTTPDVAVSGTLTGNAHYMGQTITFSVSVNPSHGTVSITNTATGAFKYTPTQGYAGSDSFTFKVVDQWGSSSTATESVTVNDVAPTVSGTTSFSMTHNTTHNGSFTSTQKYTGQVLTFVKVTSPAHGTWNLTAGTGAYTYTPTTGYKGSDSFSVKVTDQWGTASNTLTVTVTVK